MPPSHDIAGLGTAEAAALAPDCSDAAATIVPSGACFAGASADSSVVGAVSSAGSAGLCAGSGSCAAVPCLDGIEVAPADGTVTPLSDAAAEPSADSFVCCAADIAAGTCPEACKGLTAFSHNTPTVGIATRS